MTAYAFDPGSRAVFATWRAGRAHRACPLTVVPSGVPVERVDSLINALDGLSSALWDTYVHPASQFGEPDVEREAFPRALRAVTAPELPRDGMITVSLCRVEECGNRVGRALRALGLGDGFTTLIAEEVAREQAAVEAAEAGELRGRASQAVALSRIGASPTQIDAAWQALLDDPLGSHGRLLTEFEPSAAGIAAAACLRCAAQLAEGVSGVAWTEVVAEADDVEAFPVLTPTKVLTMLAKGATERDAVTTLLRDAHAVADGALNDSAQVRRLMDSDVDECLQVRLTPLDPHRPAPDLLEDLLAGIDACFVLWQEYADEPELGEDAFSGDLRAAMQARHAPS
jgi:hypothetical protein